MIVDFRVRPPYRGFKDLHLYGERNPNPDPVTASGLSLDLPEFKSRSELSMDFFMDEMDEAGIDIGVVMGRQSPEPFGAVPNDDIAALIEEVPGRFVGFGGADVSDASKAIEEVKKCAGLGLVGMAFDNGFCDPPLYDDDASAMEVYQACADLGMIVSITSSIFLGPDLSYCNPIHIQRVAHAFPELTIVIPHACWPWSTLACGVAFQCSNLYLIPDFYGYIPNTPGAEDYVESANYFMSYRLLFGSSYPVRPLGQSVQLFADLAFKSDEVRDRALGLNAKRVLGL